MAEETVRVDSNEDLDSLIQRLKRSGSKEVVLAVPEDARALQTLDQFNVLRREVKDAGLDVTFMGGNKTTRGLAKILGFHTREGNVPGTNNGGGSTVEAAPVAVPASYASLNDATIPFPTPNMNGNGATRSFGGPPSGFVVNGNGNGNFNGMNETLTPPPANRSAQDFFSEVQNFQPGFAANLTPPPPPGNGIYNDNPLNREGDTVMSRDSMPNFFDDIPNEAAPQRPRADFSFSAGDDAGGRTMSFEEAMRNGVLNEEGDDTNFAFGGPSSVENDIAYGDDGPDTALGNFQTGGRETTTSGKRVRGGRNNRTKTNNRATGTNTRAGRNVVLPAGLAALGGRVRQVFVPVKPPAPGTAGMMRPEIDPVTRRRRAQSSRRNTFIALLIAVVVLILVLVLLLPSITGNSNGTGPFVTGNSGGPTTVNVSLLMKDQPQPSQNVKLLFVPVDNSSATTAGTTANATTTSAATKGATNSTTAGAATAGASAATSGSAGSLQVSTIDTGQVSADGTYPAFGSRVVSTQAQGTATIINYGGGTGLSAGAVVYRNPSTGVSYHVVNSVSVPAGNIFSSKPGVASVQLVADPGSGTKGNMQKGFIAQIGNALGIEAGPITGGQDKNVAVVSAKDVQALQNQLVAQARQQALAKAQGNFNAATQAIVPIPTGNPTCTFNPSANQDAANGKFTGSCKVSFKAYVYNKDALQKAVAQEVGVSSEQQIDPNTLQMDDSKGQLTQQNGQNFFTVPVTYSTYNNLDANAIKQAIAGKSPDQAKNAIMTQFGTDVSNVDFGKFSGASLPTADNLQVTILPASQASQISSTAGASGSPQPSSTAGVAGTPQATAATSTTPTPTTGS